MSNATEQERENAVYVLPADYSETQFELSEDEIAFNSFKEEAHDNENYSKITVSRVPMNRHGQRASQKLHFLFECTVDEYTYSQLLSKLRDEYRTGFYKIQARNEKGQLKLNKTVAVEAPRSDTDTASGDGGTTAVIEQFSRSLAEQQAEMRDMMQSMIGPQTGGDAIDQIVKIAAAVAPILAALGISRPDAAPAPRTLIEQLTEMKMVQEMFSGGGDDSALGGDANLYSLLSETVKAFGGPIAKAIAAGAESGQLSNEGLVKLPAPAAPSETTQATEVENVETKENENMAMRQNIHIMIQNAKRKVPAKMFASILVSNTPEEKQDELWEFISAEKCVDMLIELEPAAAPHREWFDDLREAVIALMSEDEPEESILEDYEIDPHFVVATSKDEIERHAFEPMVGVITCALCGFTEKYKSHLQPGEDEDSLAGSEVVADVEVKETPTSASPSDSNPASDT